MKTIRFRCKGETTRELCALREAQGHLKDLTEKNAAKLKKEILEMGFTAPVNVWEDRGICHILDGHQRVRVLNLLRSEGYEIPKVPVNLIEAENLREAKRLCLGMASQYGSVQSEGLYEFMAELQLDDRIFENVRFPELPEGKFAAEFGDNEDGRKDSVEVQ
jgi:hypothetical protein